MKKRVIAMLLAATMSLSLFACGAKEEESVVEELEEAEEVVEEAEPEIVTGVNIIPGGDFSQSNSYWDIYQESGGVGSFNVASGQLTAKVFATGVVDHGVQIYCGGFEMLQGGRYEMSFDIDSTVDRTIIWRIQYNSGDYHAYVEERDVEIGPEKKTITCEFVMNEASDPAPRLCFNIGDKDMAQGLGEHEIHLDNVSLVLLDASSAAKVDTTTAQVDINLNQLGYKPSDTKRIVFRDATKDTEFSIVDESGKTVYEGKIEGDATKGGAGEHVSYGDFSEFKNPGTYKVVAANSGESYPFTIAEDVYNDAFDAVIKMFYYQRCGMELTEEYAGDFAHKACHNAKALLYEDKKTELDVSGGWHDAGDYGRYPSAAAKAVADLMLSYERYPEAFSDSVGIPESGNGIPDVLDETKYELEWLLKMQAKDGGVYHKVTGLNFEGIDMPENCNDQLYVLPVSKTATGDFAAVMYMASRVYANVDAAFAKKCLAAAQKALPAFEARMNERNFTNPADVKTGEYKDGSSKDEYLWALCEGYKTTGDKDILEKIKTFDFSKLKVEDDGMGWASVTEYAYYAALTSEYGLDGVAFDFKGRMKELADKAKTNTLTDTYGSSIIDDYPWGSNMTICNNGMLFLMMADITGDKTYIDGAMKQLDYIYGCNTNSYSFVTGYGGLYPEHPHHRPSQTLGKCVPGMLVGGPDSALEDPFAVAVLLGQPKAHCYIDNEQTYSCNEITIYWNSPLVYLMAGAISK